MQFLNLESSNSFSFYSRFFSSVGLSFKTSLIFSKCFFMSVKSNWSKFVAPKSFGKRLKNDSVKFFLTRSFSPNSVPRTYAHQLQTSSTSGVTSIGFPYQRFKIYKSLTLKSGLTPCGVYSGTKVTPLCSSTVHLVPPLPISWSAAEPSELLLSWRALLF